MNSHDPKRELKQVLEKLARRQLKLRFWSELGAACASAAFIGLVFVYLTNSKIMGGGWGFRITIFLAITLSIIACIRAAGRKMDVRQIARDIEARHPELEAKLLTAVQQNPPLDGALGYLQQRIIEEALLHHRQRDWSRVMPLQRVTLAQMAQVLALCLLVAVLWNLRWHGRTSGALITKFSDGEVEVLPGDATLEKGSSLVVLTKFSGPLPANVDLVVGEEPQPVHRVALAKSLADPVFGGSVPNVESNFTYRIEYSGKETRAYTVKVFEYPRLERADAEVHFPEYTLQTNKVIPDTRRVSAVQGSQLTVRMQLNKPVVSGQLISRDKAQAKIALQVETNKAAASFKDYALDVSRTYELQLVDAEGRTNKVPALFVFEALPNRVPEMKLASPRGDIRPSPLEEISFEGTVWDDFGIEAYGLGFTVAGQDPRLVTLGHGVAGKEKKQFQHVLRVEDLQLKPDDLVAWFTWADDIGPDGQVRRTSGDLFFGEIRPFEEVFREGQGGEQGQQAGQQGGGNSPTAKLAELQKQIISATWKVQRQYGFTNARQSSLTPSWERFEARKKSAVKRHLQADMPRFIRVAGFPVMGQVSRSPDAGRPPRSVDNSQRKPLIMKGAYEDDVQVIRDAMADALKQVEQNSSRAADPRAEGLWEATKKAMEHSLKLMDEALKSPARLSEALAAEKAAYQALLKLNEHEFQVMRSQRQNQSGSSRDAQMQRQLEQLDFKQSDDRYETQRQAQQPQNTERREDLQVMNRLQELARRQQDVNEKLKELQTALQEAQTEKEREEIRRQLKRLQEEEQQMLADVDEVRQRMERPENQSRMSDERKQLEQTREDIQKASEQASQGSPGQALASGTRAQRQLQEMREGMRKENANQFADDLRQMRSEARELERKQEEILKNLQAESGNKEQKSLSDGVDKDAVQKALEQQKMKMTNLVERATQLSQESELPEPLLSKELYDSLRKFSQDTGKGVKDLQDTLMNRGQMPRSLYERLKESKDVDSSKLMDITSEMVRQDMLGQAQESAEVAKGAIEQLKQGMERAAGSVLGDDTESLRLAQEQLDRLTEQLSKEMADDGQSSTNRARAAGSNNGSQQQASNRQQGNESKPGETQQPGEQPGGSQQGQQNTPGEGQGQSTQQANSGKGGQGQAQSEGQGNQQAGGDNQGQADSRGEQAQAQANNGGARNPGNTGPIRGNTAQGRGSRRTGNQLGSDGGGGEGADISGSLNRDLDRMLTDGGRRGGPITGEDFTAWSDDLRDVEEMVEIPDLRNQVARVRDRARQLRQDFTRERKKPDWAVVRLEVMKPLAQVRDQIAEELARRQSKDALVPIDRDPVPSRYSELVRRYYEELGKDH